MPENVLPLPLGPVEWHCWCGVVIVYDGDRALEAEAMGEQWTDPRIIEHRKGHKREK